MTDELDETVLDPSRGDVELSIFRSAMERELRANDGKGGWRDVDVAVLVADVGYHLLKLINALRNDEKTRILEHAADVGNCAMFVADVAGALTLDVLHARIDEPDLVVSSGEVAAAQTMPGDPRRERLELARADEGVPF